MDEGDIPTSAGYLTAAWRAIAEASAATSAAQRFELAQVAAVRAASAVIADESLAGRVRRCGPSGGGSLWRLLGSCVPELAEWADFFAATAPLRRGLRSARSAEPVISERMADDLLRDADRFAHEVRAWLLRRRTRTAHARSGAAR
ncbi:hypothetical protein EK0264_01850 [Epidermidibacterium keratini]|uniref:SAV-6107-like HEPN domain-containing protein n=1 Tax=Epidermidibacterium keratini TaxID=1891644 RepID=A0A7L4YJY4_9ACTN|nr:SAV_6107 family HEPN domain-containing protein [Epidermidibacterium keratini]QHB99153.1 hypothetical protein EK0264_01850 [Epidermidibacterium keratini]